MITIPNLLGMNRLLTWFFYDDLLGMHNLAIMKMSEFGKLFAPELLEPRFVGRVGTFTWNIFKTRPESPKRHILSLLKKTHLFINPAGRLFFGTRGCEIGLFSPNLIFIGRKR